jgi:hypothetical protein
MLKIDQINQGYSFFLFINTYCLEEATHFCINRAIHRLCSLMRKMDAKTVLIESQNHFLPEIEDECLALGKYYNEKIKIKAHRFTFILKEVSSWEEILQLESYLFLANCILINFQEPKDKRWISYLFKAVITLPKIYQNKFLSISLLNNYLHVYKTFNCKIIFDEKLRDYKEYTITGTFFCQQNTVTSVCAHASLCMTINNIQGLRDELILPEDINKIIGVKHYLQNGLSKEDIDKVLKDYNLSFDYIDFFVNPYVEYNDFVYKYIESKWLFDFSRD